MAVEGRWRNICNSRGISEGRRQEVQPLPYEISLEIVYQTWMRDSSSYICSTLRKDNNRKRVVLGEMKKIMFQQMRGGNVL